MANKPTEKETTPSVARTYRYDAIVHLKLEKMRKKKRMKNINQLVSKILQDATKSVKL